MMTISGFCATLFQILLCFMLCQTCYSTVSDIQCLKRLKASVDPNNKLHWTFENNTEGSICTFSGVECWHPNENKIVSLRLGSMDLKGQFPDVRFCRLFRCLRGKYPDSSGALMRGVHAVTSGRHNTAGSSGALTRAV